MVLKHPPRAVHKGILHPQIHDQPGHLTPASNVIGRTVREASCQTRSSR
jgi:hypothetical protein